MFSMTMMVTLDPAVADFNTVQERLARRRRAPVHAGSHPARGRLPSDVRDLADILVRLGRLADSTGDASVKVLVAPISTSRATERVLWALDPCDRMGA